MDCPPGSASRGRSRAAREEEGVEEGARARQRTGKKGGRSGKKRKSKRVEYQAAPPPSEGTIGGFSPLLLGVPVVALLAGAFWWFRMRGGTVSLPSLGKRPSAGDDDDAPPAIPDRVPDLAAMLAGKSSGPEVLDRKAKKELGESGWLMCGGLRGSHGRSAHTYAQGGPRKVWIRL